MIKKILFSFALSSFILSACLMEKPEEKIYSILENVVDMENTFKEQQKPIAQLEKQEHELFNKIVSLNMEQYDQIQSLSKEALKILDERDNMMNKELESMKQSKEEFAKIKDAVSKIKDENLKEQIKNLQETMDKRYETYDQLYSNYLEALKLDRELYHLLQKKDLSLNKLEEHIQLINNAYKKVKEENDTFNQLTKKYNEMKMNFYLDAELNIEES